MASTFVRLDSLAELKRAIDTGGQNLGGSEFAKNFSAYVNAAIASVNFGHRILTAPVSDAVFSQQKVQHVLVGKSWLHAIVFQRILVSTYADLGTSLDVQRKDRDLLGLIHGFITSDIDAAISGHPPENITASLIPTLPSNIQALLNTIPYINFPVKAGGHFPEHITASVNITQPVNFSVYVRRGEIGTLDIAASITQVGGFDDLSTFVRSTRAAISDFGVSIEEKILGNITAFINGNISSDIGGIINAERFNSLFGIIWNWTRQAVGEMKAYIRRIDHAVKDLPVDTVRAIISTHTSDKVPNLDRVSKPFYQNRYVFGTGSRGFFLLTLEPVFGYFPDLHAEIFAQQFFRLNIKAYIRVAARQSDGIIVSVLGVSPYVNINKITISPNPLKDLSVSIVQRGGFKQLQAQIRPLHSTSTGTSEDADYIYTAATYRFLLGTGRGLFIPEVNVPQIKVTTFRNNHPRPDLRAFIQGWNEINFGAYIRDYTFMSLSASLFAVDDGMFKDLFVQLIPAHIKSFSASVVPVGYYRHLAASISSGGGVSHIGASIVSFINPLAFDVVPVSTKPFSNIGAIINYDELVSCSSTSTFSSINAFIRGFFASDTNTSSDIGATLNVLRLLSDVNAEVIGRKRTRIRVLTLSFRANTRGSSSTGASITPLVKVVSDISVEIAGLSHQTDITASIIPARKVLSGVLLTESENVVDFRSGDTEEVFVTFRSKVGEYVYEKLTNTVYPTDRGTWAIDLRTAKRQELFFDRSPENRTRVIDGVVEYYSLDAAIRDALTFICDRQQENIGASIGGVGKAISFAAAVNVVGADNLSNIKAGIVSVYNSPEIFASVNTGLGSSRFESVMGVIFPANESQESLSAQVTGEHSKDFGVSVVGV